MTAQRDGRVALITGGGSGIGRGTAIALAESGYSVVVSGRRESVLTATVDEIASRGGRAAAVRGDVTSTSDCERLVARTVETFGDLHVLVNNAGVAASGPLAEASEETVHSVVDVDLKGPIFMTRAALEQLRRHRETGGAAVINISSSVTLMALKNYSIYSAAKAGVDMLTRCLALELAADRIRVNALCPGVVETPIFETMMPAEEAKAYVAQFDDFVPLGRRGQPADVARAVRFLVGSEGEWITGAVIPIDGGLSLGPN